MAVISFGMEESEIFGVRKAVFRMILIRTRSRLSEAADLEETQLAQMAEGILFHDVDRPQRERLGDAVLGAVMQLREEVSAGKRLEEPVRAGIEELLEDLENFLRARLQP